MRSRIRRSALPWLTPIALACLGIDECGDGLGKPYRNNLLMRLG